MTGRPFADPAMRRLYYRWVAMRQRCCNPKSKDYKNYGGRGIKICDRWQDFDLFVADMGMPPVGALLDRKDNSGDYEPNNCCWSMRTAQNRNRRNVLISPEIAVEIRQRRYAEGLSIRRLGNLYGINHGNVSRILHDRIWKV